MAKYIVCITVTIPITKVFEINAPDEEEAVIRAKRLLLISYIRDFDGNRVEVIEDDINFVDVALRENQ